MLRDPRSNAWAYIARDDFDSAFHLLLGRLVHAIARLDFIVGLQLRYWAHKDDTSIHKLLKPGTPRLHERLKTLEELVSAAWSVPHYEGQKEIREWFRLAHQARGLRNEYAHGRWGVPGKHSFTESGRLSDAKPLLVFVPLDWNMLDSCSDNNIELTLEEFATQVEEAENLATRFWNLISKYGEYLYPGLNLTAP